MEHFRYEVSFENITTQVTFRDIIFLLVEATSTTGTFSGGRVHSDDFDGAERANSDTNSGEVSDGATEPNVIS